MGGGRLELIEPDGRRFVFGDPGAELRSTLEVHSPAFYRAMLGGSVGMGEAYRDGVWDCDDTMTLTRIACRPSPTAATTSYPDRLPQPAGP